MKNGDKLSCLYCTTFIQSIIVLIWQIGEMFDVGPFEGPYVPESQRSWKAELSIMKYYRTNPQNKHSLRLAELQLRQSLTKAAALNLKIKPSFKLKFFSIATVQGCSLIFFYIKGYLLKVFPKVKLEETQPHSTILSVGVLYLYH